MKQRLIASALFGASAVLAALQVSGLPQDQQGWIALAGVFFAAAYGKFSSNQTVVAPNRPVWTDEHREAQK